MFAMSLTFSANDMHPGKTKIGLQIAHYNVQSVEIFF